MDAENRSEALEGVSLGTILTHLIEHPDCIASNQAAPFFRFNYGVNEIPLADLIQHIAADSRLITAADHIAVSDQTMARHLAAFFHEDPRQRYIINAAGLYATQGKGNETDENVAGDAMSLRHYTSFLFFPMNALYRLDCSDPDAVVAFAATVSTAARNFFRVRNVTPESSVGRNMTGLSEFAEAISQPGDPRLCRLLREQLIHNLMAQRALLRQEPCRRTPGLGAHLYRIVDLDEAGLAKYRLAWESRGFQHQLVAEFGFTSTSPEVQSSDKHSRREKKYKFLISPLTFHSMGRLLNASADNVVNFEHEVLFPPGSLFRVTDIQENVADDVTSGGEPRTHIFLQEVSRDAVSWVRMHGETNATGTRLFHYTIGQHLPKIINDGFIDLTLPLPGTEVAALWVSNNQEWEHSVVKSGVRDGKSIPLSKQEIHEVGKGLMRIEVKRNLIMQTWSQFIEFAAVPVETVAMLESRGEERGAVPDQWFTCLEPIYRKDWLCLEIWHAESNQWLQVDL